MLDEVVCDTHVNVRIIEAVYKMIIIQTHGVNYSVYDKAEEDETAKNCREHMADFEGHVFPDMPVSTSARIFIQPFYRG